MGWITYPFPNLNGVTVGTWNIIDKILNIHESQGIQEIFDTYRSIPIL